MTKQYLPGTSPFEAVFGSQQTRLSLAHRRQFLSLGPVRLTGKMAYVWHPTWLHPLFWLLGKVGLLIPLSGRDIPTSLDIQPYQGPDGENQQIWKRSLDFDRVVTFHTLVAFDPQIGKVVEAAGTGRFLIMIWGIRCESPDKMNWRSIGWKICLMGKTFKLPQKLSPWLFGRAEFTQVSRDEAISIDFRIKHPLLGTIFKYSGSFRVEPTNGD